MKKRVIELISLALTLSLTVAMLAGCGKAPSSSEPVSSTVASTPSSSATETDPYHVTDGPVTFTFAAAMPTSWGEAKDKQFFQDLEQKTNVHIEWNQFPLEVANERVGVLMAGSSLPDAFYTHNNFSLAQANTYGQQGLLIDLKPLIEEYAPNIAKAFNETGGWKAYDAGNGAIYTLPKIDVGFPEVQTVFTELLINKSLLEKTNMEMPTTTEEFYEVLKAIKGMTTEDGKDVIPVSYGPVYGYGDMLRGAFGIIDSTCGPSIMDGVYLQYDENSIDTIADKENYKEFIKYMNRLSTEGLMDQEVYTQDNNMFNAKGQNGQLASFIDYGGWTVVGQPKIEDGSYVAVPVLAGPDGTKLTQNRYSLIRNACDFAITRDCKDPVTLIKFIDLFYNQELDVCFESTYGPRGINWDYDAQGMLEKFPVPENFNSYGEFRASETIPAGPLYIGSEKQTHYPLSGVDLLKKEMDITRGYNDAATSLVLPPLAFTEEETAELSILRTDLMDYIKNFEATCITGQKDVEAEWDNHLKQLEKLGLTQLQEIYSAALERYNKQ